MPIKPTSPSPPPSLLTLLQPRSWLQAPPSSPDRLPTLPAQSPPHRGIAPQTQGSTWPAVGFPTAGTIRWGACPSSPHHLVSPSSPFPAGTHQSKGLVPCLHSLLGCITALVRARRRWCSALGVCGVVPQTSDYQTRPCMWLTGADNVAWPSLCPLSCPFVVAAVPPSLPATPPPSLQVPISPRALFHACTACWAASLLSCVRALV
jgi:hypothetical protein